MDLPVVKISIQLSPIMAFLRVIKPFEGNEAFSEAGNHFRIQFG